MSSSINKTDIEFALRILRVKSQEFNQLGIGDKAVSLDKAYHFFLNLQDQIEQMNHMGEYLIKAAKTLHNPEKEFKADLKELLDEQSDEIPF